MVMMDKLDSSMKKIEVDINLYHRPKLTLKKRVRLDLRPSTITLVEENSG